MLEIMKQLNCCSSFAAAGNPAFQKKKKKWLLVAMSFFGSSSRVPRACYSSHAQCWSWEHVIMLKWRINREGTIVMVVWCESVTTTSKRPSEKEILQLSSLPRTASQKRRWIYLRERAIVSLWLRRSSTDFLLQLCTDKNSSYAFYSSWNSEMKAWTAVKISNEVEIYFLFPQPLQFLAC